uniref:arginine--tRNA ligase domain-containing protein n=1 Tax=Pontibaca methylaminivorans TaxID=515897 RepID=UPI002FD8A324
MNLFGDIRASVIGALEAMQAEGALPAELGLDAVTVEPPRDPAHGDMATNAAMVLAKPARQKPREIAEALAARLAADPRFLSAEVAGPGFLNLRLAPSLWQGVIGHVLGAGDEFGRSDLGQGRRVNVEYVSANPTGPLHVGHTRGAVFGDALASLLAYAGFDVTREYYINDGGAQVDVLARSVYLRYLEALGQEVAFEDGTYPGDYLIPVGEAVAREKGDAWVGQPEEVWLAELRERATGAMMDLIRADLAALGVKMDVFFSERSLYGTGRIESAIRDLDEKGLIYRGVLEPPRGKTP